MSLPSQEIESIVRMVIDRLRDGLLTSGEVTSATPTAIVSTAKTTTPAAPTSPGTLVIEDSVITLQSLGDRLSGVTTLQVSKRSVVTPAVHDELRKRKIKLVRGTTNAATPSTNTSSSNLAATNTTTNSSSKSAVTMNVIASDAKLKVVRGVNKLIAVQSIVDHVDTDKLASSLTMGNTRTLWCSALPFAAAVSLASQAPRLRSITLSQAADLQRAVREANPHVIVVDEKHWTSFQVARLVQAWSQISVQGGVA